VDNIEGFVTITGGKATTLRLMAEKVTDMACAKLGIDTPCTTAEVPLRSYREFVA
jgi:glycerol-3-phosphate dehydrogenase